MRLDEVLGTPYWFELERQGTGFVARFDAGPGEDEPVEVVFQHWAKPDLYETYFDRGGSLGVTGGGDALRIFSTVLTAAREFAARVRPRAITFTAKNDEPSRVALYRRLAKRFAPGSGYRDVTDDLGRVEDEPIRDWFEHRVRRYSDESHTLLVREDLLKRG